jgi:GT2 family glycosyltransferase
VPRSGWIEKWDPEDKVFWESRSRYVARRNLVFSIFSARPEAEFPQPVRVFFTDLEDLATQLHDEQRMTPEEAFEREFAFENDRYVEKKGFSVTANLFCRRSVFDTVGGYRTGVSEDYDWCLRAREAGFRIGYAPDAVVGHPARKDWPALLKKWRRLNSETFELMAERRFGRVQWMLRTWALPLSALAHTPRVLASRRIPRTSQRMAALSVLYRLRMWRFFHSHAVIAGRKD